MRSFICVFNVVEKTPPTTETLVEDQGKGKGGKGAKGKGRMSLAKSLRQSQLKQAARAKTLTQPTEEEVNDEVTEEITDETAEEITEEVILKPEPQVQTTAFMEPDNYGMEGELEVEFVVPESVSEIGSNHYFVYE